MDLAREHVAAFRAAARVSPVAVAFAGRKPAEGVLNGDGDVATEGAASRGHVRYMRVLSVTLLAGDAPEKHAPGDPVTVTVRGERIEGRLADTGWRRAGELVSFDVTT